MIIEGLSPQTVHWVGRSCEPRYEVVLQSVQIQSLIGHNKKHLALSLWRIP